MEKRILRPLIAILITLSFSLAIHAKTGVFEPNDASLSGTLKINKERIGYWKKNSAATWKLKKVKPGKYHVSINYAVDANEGGIVSLMIDDKLAGKFKVANTGGWRNYKVITVGPVTIEKDSQTITVTGTPNAKYLMNMGNVTLKKVK